MDDVLMMILHLTSLKLQFSRISFYLPCEFIVLL